MASPHKVAEGATTFKTHAAEDRSTAEEVKTLFEVHHRILAEYRQRNYAIVERTLILLGIVGGWLATRQADGTPKLGIALAVMLGITGACVALGINMFTYNEHVKVVRKLSRHLHVQQFYPLKWQTDHRLRRTVILPLFLFAWLLAIAAVCVFRSLPIY